MEEENKTVQEVYQKMAHLCSRSEQCSPDILRKIRESGVDQLTAQSLISRLEKENFLDDRRFVSLYVREKFKINRWGRIKMHYYLKMKGLKEEIIQSGFTELDEDAYVEMLVKTMKEKARSIKKSDKYEKMGQVIRYAQGRGFEPELIHRYLNAAMT